MTDLFSTIFQYGDAIINWAFGYFNTFSQTVSAVLQASLYPIVCVINYGYSDANTIYNVLATTINIFIQLPALVQGFFTAYTPTNLPSAWVLLFLMMLSIEIYLTIIHLVMFLKKWLPSIPLIGGG
jgi:hypothetical protein